MGKHSESKCEDCGEKLKDGQQVVTTIISAGVLSEGEVIESVEISSEITHSDCSEAD